MYPMLGILIASMGLLLLCNIVTSNEVVLVHNADTTVADALARKVRVMCCITTSVSDDSKKVQAIKDTWGKRCNALAFINYLESVSDINWPKLTIQQKYGLHTVFEQYKAKANWFIVSSGGYMLVENLRFMLADYEPAEEIYFKPAIEKEEGLEFVISNNGLSRLMVTDLSYYPLCKFSTDSVISSSCLDSIGLKHMDSKDFLNRERILPKSPYDNEHKKSYCYSDFAVSFDDMDPHLMYVIDYLIYQLRPYGINFDTNLPKSQKEVNRLLQRKRSKFEDAMQKNYI